LAWTAKKWIVSTFLVGHLIALGVWNLPGGPIQDRYAKYFLPYMHLTGMAQHWGMFAPDPAKESSTLEAITRDSKGMLGSFQFPKLTGMPLWRSFWLFRHAKFAANMANDDCKPMREYAARNAVRALDPPADRFPLDVQLIYQIRPTPPVGTRADQVLLRPKIAIIETFRFDTKAEVQP
jgi:hypothetical protein